MVVMVVILAKLVRASSKRFMHLEVQGRKVGETIMAKLKPIDIVSWLLRGVCSGC